MPETAALDAWVPKYQSWTKTALPLLAKGNAKEAFSTYPWFTTEGDPFARLSKPAKDSRFALLTTGGYSIEGVHQPFTGLPNLKGEVPEVHAVPLDVDRTKLTINHKGYDHRFAKEDINVNLPLDRLVEMEKDGEIGSIAKETYVLMGLIPDVAPLLRETLPQIVERLKAESVDAALLVPS